MHVLYSSGSDSCWRAYTISTGSFTPMGHPCMHVRGERSPSGLLGEGVRNVKKLLFQADRDVRSPFCGQCCYQLYPPLPPVGGGWGLGGDLTRSLI